MTTATELRAFQALTGVFVIAGDDVRQVTVQVFATTAAGRDKLATVVGEALGAPVDAIGRSRYVEDGCVLVEVLSEEE